MNPARTVRKYSGLCLGITRHPCDNPHALYQALLKAVKRWVGEGGKATLVGAPDADDVAFIITLGEIM